MHAISTLVGEPAAAWRRARAPWRLAYAVGTGLMLVGLAHGVAWLVVGGAWDGPVSFRKPFSFGLSFGLTTITIAWITDRLGVRARTGWLLLLPLVVADTSEVVWVSLQRARGVASHFNLTTPLDEMLFNVMGGAAVAVAAAVIVTVTAIAFRHRDDDAAMTLALRAGLAVLLVAMVVGGAMIGVGTARAAQGQTTDLVRWGAAGNMKVSHAIGMHAVQVLPGMALWLSATPLPAAARRRIVAVAVAGYSGILAAGTLQWLDGRALIDPGWIDGALWLASIATLVTALGSAVLAARTPPSAAQPA